ncbi:hypothetical protein EDB83DRAFT_2502485 [Lactarius deliciosus]|nr:hypothetical protein EDB83DRAFT_2502485 [Lactarius deliciosus]
MESPDVPSSLYLIVPDSSSSSSDSASSESSPQTSLTSSPALIPKEDPHHDPHDPPILGKQAHIHSDQPILYLPPLLSSLPCSFPSHTHASTDRVPKTTEARLPDINPASLSLHRALHNFYPLTDDYAATTYAEAFNWGELELPEEDEHDWYCVAFRSIRKPDSETLYEADRLAHEEAIKNGGLIMYWYGSPDPETGLNLATCVWQSRADAVAANSRPHHIRAMRQAASGRWTLRKIAGSRYLEVLPYVVEGR